MTRNTSTIDLTTGKYVLALELVQVLDEQLQRGYPHLRDTNGRLLTELDQVVLAILENRWPAEGVTENANDRDQRQIDRLKTRPLSEPA